MKKSVFKTSVIVFIFTFLINFVWESFHAVWFYTGISDYKASAFVRLMSYASSIDAIIITAIFLVGCLLFRGYWLPLKSRGVWFTVIAGVVVAIIIEAKALYLNQWSYNELMPTVFSVGISPLVQLALTGLLVFYIVSKLK